MGERRQYSYKTIDENRPIGDFPCHRKLNQMNVICRFLTVLCERKMLIPSSESEERESEAESLKELQ